MRDIINLTSSETQEINNKFPYLIDLINCEQNGFYEIASISPFDHLLSEEDASSKIDDVTENEAQVYNNNLYNFVVSLGRETTLLSVKTCGRKKNKLKIRRFTSNEALKRKLKLKHQFAPNTSRFILLLPELESIYFENWDFTHHIFSKKTAKNELIKKLATENMLHVIK